VNLKRLKSYVLAEMLFALLMISIGCVVPLIGLKQANLKHQAALYAVEALALGGLGLQLVIYILNIRRRPLRLYLGISLLATGLVLLIASRVK
jgi:hypothetical protein